MTTIAERPQSPTLTALLADRLDRDPQLGPRDLDRMVFERGFPITDDGVTTFAYRGDVDAVYLVHFGLGLPEDLSFERLPDSNWWTLALSLPAGTRMEYKLHIKDGDHQYDTPDPLNPFEARNPFGHNSVCRSHGYSVPPWGQRDPEAKEGLQRKLTVPSEHLNRLVDVTLYLPASFSMEPEHRYPLVVMHDGIDYLHYADAAMVLDNMIHRGVTPEFCVAFCEPGDRLTEYADDERHARFIGEELVPYLDGHLPLVGDREHRCLVGASFGAIATLSTAARFPDMFGSLLLQSGSFDGAALDGAQRDGELWRPVNEFVRRFVDSPVGVADRIFMSCGIYEPLIVDNRAMRIVLAGTDADVVLAEQLDSHTWGCWRDSLGLGLTWLFENSFRSRDVRPFDTADAPDTSDEASVKGSE
jgi:enterochelin esterase-like enzyme